MTFPHPHRSEIIAFLRSLRESFIAAFESLEGQNHQFVRTAWDYHDEGGGEMAVLRGNQFEKAAVNWSGVGGPTFPMSDAHGPFFATGVSLITHMSNPHVPTVHFNIRFIDTAAGHWFGGGYDLSPMGFPYEEDTKHFHRIAQETLDPFGRELYPRFSQGAREYFYIVHRKRERGVGGIFFDHINSGNFREDQQMWESVGNSFLKAIIPIYQKRIHQPYKPEDKEKQLIHRGHYAEFNLVYDRGTQFGFKSGGNTEAILCSMPPCAKW